MQTTMNFLSNNVDNGCPVPCSQQSFDVKINLFHKNSFIDVLEAYPSDVLDSKAFISIFYSSVLVETRVETYLYDLGNFLTSAGGNLGLLLGFSCLSLLFAFLHCLKRNLKKSLACKKTKKTIIKIWWLSTNPQVFRLGLFVNKYQYNHNLPKNIFVKIWQLSFRK